MTITIIGVILASFLLANFEQPIKQSSDTCPKVEQVIDKCAPVYVGDEDSPENLTLVDKYSPEIEEEDPDQKQILNK